MIRKPNLCFACLIVSMLAFYATLAWAAMPAHATEKPCLEDMPCFVWSIDGNGARGVILRKGASHKHCDRTWREGAIRYCVVDPCGFSFLEHRRLIDWRKTDRLKGDYIARRFGCDPYAFA